MIEKTLVLLKPDAVKRGIVGEIIHRFERSGLKIVGSKMIHPDEHFAKNHYTTSDTQLTNMGNNTLNDCQKMGIDVNEKFGTSDPKEIGMVVWKWNVEFLSSGPILAFVLEGLHAIQNTRTLIGSTIPMLAAPGTIRGDFSLDSAIAANQRNRSVYNLVHASGTVEEADREIALWFKPEEILSYKRIHEDLYSY